MAANQGSCRDCGGRLLGTDRGRCGNCRQATETPQERAAYLLRSKALHGADSVTGSVTMPPGSKSQAKRLVVQRGPSKGESVTPEQSVTLANESSVTALHGSVTSADRKRAATAARVKRWRDGQRRRRAE